MLIALLNSCVTLYDYSYKSIYLHLAVETELILDCV